MSVGDRHVIPVAAIEVIEGGKALWIHDRNGCTVLRVQCTGRIVLDLACQAPAAHGDVHVIGDIKLCVPGGLDEQDEAG